MDLKQTCASSTEETLSAILLASVGQTFVRNFGPSEGVVVINLSSLMQQVVLAIMGYM